MIMVGTFKPVESSQCHKEMVQLKAASLGKTGTRPLILLTAKILMD